MKNITIIFMMLLASLSFAQNQPIDFEPGGFGADWTWTVFENGPTPPPLEIIPNPDPNGINTSATVAQFTAMEAGNPWAGVESAHGVDLGTFQWDDDNRIVKIHVWKPVISNVGIKFATETGWAEQEILVPNTVTNEWEELTFDFSDAINPPDGNGILGQIIIFPDFTNRDQDNVIYFDNITFHPVGDDPPADGPDVAAPTPPALPPNEVISIFSDAFTNVEDTDFNPPWGQSTQVSIIDIEGSSTLKYANFNYQGTQFASPLDVSEMGFIHLDMWTADATSVNFFIISPGPVETAYALPITPNEWVSYDIPLAEFAPVDLSDVIQFKFDGGDGTPTIYLDNLYFYTGEVEEGTDATLSDLQIDGTTVEGFSPTVLNYSVALPDGTTEVPDVTATTNDPDATAVITPADAIPGTTSILVTSANTEVELTYTVAFTLENGDLTGPNHPIDFEPDGFGADWTWTVFENGPTPPPLEIIANPDPNGINTSATVAQFTAMEAGNPWAGVESQHGVDLGTFEWDDDNRIVKIQVWKPVISNVGIKFATETGWAEPEILVPNTVTNEWEELTFDFSDAINPPDGNGILGQIIIFPDYQDRDQDNVVYFDNITFHPVGDDPPADEPDVAAPTPPALPPNEVISIFSDAFTNVEDTDFFPDWGQSTQVSIIDIEGSSTLKYENFNYQGTQFASPIDASEMDYIHLDMWTADATSVNFFLVSPGPVETAYALPITPNEWVSYDIPLSEFAPVDLSDVIQFKFDGGDGTQTIYLDNLYFYTDEVEEGSDATLSDLQVDGTTVDGFSPSILNYSVVLPEGTTEVPDVTATTNDPDATAEITPADAIPGTTSILVTSANTEVELTYTVAFSLDTGDPTGPNHPIDFEPGGFGADWEWNVFENDTNPPLEIIPNPDPSDINPSSTVAKFTALEAGQPWAGTESVEGYLGEFLWDEDNSIVRIMVWKPVISDVGIKFDAGAPPNDWSAGEIRVPNTVVNEWEELVFDFSDSPNPPEEYGGLKRIIIFPDFDDDGREQDNIIYFDNIVFGEEGVTPPEEPETAAPAPPARDPEDVISVFSEAYANVEGTNFDPDWDQSTQVSIIEIEGNETLKYEDFDYQGIEFAEALDVSEMETLHLDMWTGDATAVNISLISTGPEETAYALSITPNQWVSYDIPLSEFAGVDLEDVIQVKFDGGDGTPTIYLDNLYFYKVPTSVTDLNRDEFTVYPNPVRAGDLVMLSTQAKQVDVFDITGKLIRSLVNTSSVETGGMNRGVYFMRIHSNEGKIQVNKLIVN